MRTTSKLLIFGLFGALLIFFPQAAQIVFGVAVWIAVACLLDFPSAVKSRRARQQGRKMYRFFRALFLLPFRLVKMLLPRPLRRAL